MINLTRICLLILIAAFVLAKSSSQKKASVLDVQKIDVDQNANTTFHIKNLNIQKALMVNVESQESPPAFGQFKLTITDTKSKSQECLFKYRNNLCVMSSPTEEVNMVLTCLQKHCQFSIVFSQRVLVQVGEAAFKRKLAVPGEIYQLGLRKFNSILEVYSQREEHEVLSQEIEVYCNIHAFPLLQTEELDTNSAVFGLKPISKEADQFIYVENHSTKNEILKLSLKTHNGELRDGISIVDFIENYGKHSHNNYTFIGNFHKNLHAKVRVFSPRDPKEIPVSFSVRGRVNELDQEKVVREIKLPIDFQGHKFFDFSFSITKTVHHSFKFISFQVMLGEVEDKSVFFEIEVHDMDSFEVSIFDNIYFASEAGELLHFTVEPQVKLQLASGDKQIQILTNANQKYFSNTQSCSLHKGCTIEIKTENQCKNCSFSFNLKDEDIKNHIIYYQVKEDTIQGKVDIEEEIYFKYSMNGRSATQIIVNSANVIIYANFHNYQRCQLPSAACHEYAINHQNPMIVRNRHESPVELVLAVVGLEKTSFKVRFLNEKNGLEVKLGERFTYLMDNEEKDLDIKFVFDSSTLEDTHSLHFNLISPLHSLKLTVINLDGQHVESLQGYVSFKKQEIHNQFFTIRIQKINQYFDEYVHFTLVVSTTDLAVRLDSTITHYQKYMPKETKTFLIEYDASDVNALNIYTENLQKEKATMTLRIKQSSSIQEEHKTIITHKLIRDYEFIDLDADLEELDLCDDTNCELEISIQNEGGSELEQSLTLMVEESLIGLDDSIWSIFQINELTRNNHFYFIPRNQGKPINILFNTDDNNLYLTFRIYNTKNSINPQGWPFGHAAADDTIHIANSQEIVIAPEDAELKACWPTCVVLININEAKKSNEKKSLEHSVIKSYKILATNYIMELLEDTKLQFSLKNEEEKVLFIQASNILKYDKLTFFTYYSFGRARISASVVSNDREYKLNGQKDFIFEELETSLPTYLIAGIINRELLNLESVMLKLTVQAQSNLKMTLEYSSLLKDIYRLKMDELEVATLRKGEEAWYEFLPERDFALKLYRVKGFPLFQVFKCNEEKYAECLNHHKMLFEAATVQFLQTEERVKEEKEKDGIVTDSSNQTFPFEVFLQKSFELRDQQCQKCIYYMWIFCFEGDLELTINIRTAFSEIELKEMTSLNERAEFGQHNKYLVNLIHDKDAIISVTILEGSASVTIADSSSTLFTQQLNSAENNYKDFTIPAEEEQQEEEETEVKEDINVFGKLRKTNEKHVFKHVHVTVSTTSEGPVQYLISYSVGSSSLYLEDGVVLQKNLIPDIPHTYFYRNHNRKENAYLTLSSQLDSDYLFSGAKNGLSVKFYYYPDASDRNNKETFEPELPPQRNQNYLGSTLTHVYELPSKYELYQIEITASSYLKVTASINHQELVYLPLGFDYLVKLHPSQILNLVVDSPNAEYLEVKIKKCDQSTPTLQYTNDAQEFKKGIFEAEMDIDSSYFHQFINTKKSSKTLHLRLIGSEQQDSLLTVSVSGTTRQGRQKAPAYKAGKKGVIDYQMIQAGTVEISFAPVSCGEHCNSSFVYYLVVSQTMQQIYSELNCAGNYFVPEAAKVLPKAKTDLIVIGEKHFNKRKGEFRQKVKLASNQAFIGVKALAGSKQEVLYEPVQIRSFWGQLGKISFSMLIGGSLVLALVLTGVIVVSTKLARRGYKPISSQE